MVFRRGDLVISEKDFYINNEELFFGVVVHTIYNRSNPLIVKRMFMFGNTWIIINNVHMFDHMVNVTVGHNILNIILYPNGVDYLYNDRKLRTKIFVPDFQLDRLLGSLND